MAWVQNQLYVKKKNTLTVLDLIAQSQLISRKVLADMTGMSPAGITRITGTLISHRLVREEAQVAASRRGRKATSLRVCGDGLYALGICVEPDKLLICITDFDQRCLCKEEFPLEGGGPREPAMLARLAAEMYAKLDKNLIADWSRVRVAGVSVPGVVDRERGIVQYSDQMMWEQADLSTPFSNALGLPAYIENDVKACLMGERARRGIPRGEDAAFLLVGSGVGVAATSGGRLIRGCRNTAGEIEHLDFMPGVYHASTLQHHLVEANILQNARVVAPAVQTLDDLALAFRQNAGYARFLIDDVRQYLRLALQMIECFYNPQHVFLGGTTIHALAGVLGDLVDSPTVSIGENYEEACMMGASIIAQGYAIERLLDGQGGGPQPVPGL